MRRTAVSALLAATLVACGDPAQPTEAQPGLLAVNGGLQPVVEAGQLAGWTGFGFGAEQGSAVLSVTTAAGAASIAPAVWSDVGIEARLPDDVASGPTWVITSSDSLGPITLNVRPRPAYTPGIRAWGEGPALPEPRAAAAAATIHFLTDAGINALAVLFGGVRADGSLSDSTHLGQVDESGRITGWISAPDTVVPAPRRDHAMVGADPSNSRVDRRNATGQVEGVAYLIGGRDTANAVVADVHGLAVSPSGAYGLWSPLTPLPGARGGAAAIVAFGSLIVIGGYGPDSLAVPFVSVARITSDGTLNGWFAGPPLPEGRAYAAVALAGQSLFLAGGELGTIDPAAVGDTANLTGTVLAIRLSPRTGFFLDSAWTLAPPLLHPRARHAAFTLDDAVVITGGVYAGMPGTGESEFATVAPDGTLAPFTELPPPTLAALAGAPGWGFAPTLLMARDGTWRISLLGGFTPAGPTARTWSQ